MSEVVIDIKTLGVDKVKLAADQIADMGRVSEELTGKMSLSHRMVMRQAEAALKLKATQEKLNKAVKLGAISHSDMMRAMKEAHRVAREYVATDKEAVRVAKDQAKAREDLSNKIERLKQKHDAAYRVQKQLSNQIGEYDFLLENNQITLEEHIYLVDRATKEVDEFRDALVKGGNQFGRFDQNAYRSAQTLKRRFNQGVQQAGYQVGDFFVQIQSGTDVLVALGQQGSQLALVLGKNGPVIGAILAIGTALATMVIQTRKAIKSIKDFDDVIQELSESKAKLEGLYDILIAKPEEVAAKHKLARNEVLELIKAEAEWAKKNAENAITTSVGAGNASSLYKTWGLGLTSTMSYDAIAENLGVERPTINVPIVGEFPTDFSDQQKELFKKYRAAAGELKAAEELGPNEQKEALEGLIAVVQQLGVEVPDAFTQFKAELSEAIRLGSEAEKTLEKVNLELNNMSGMSPEFQVMLNNLKSGEMSQEEFGKALLPPPTQYTQVDEIDEEGVRIAYQMREAQDEIVQKRKELAQERDKALAAMDEEIHLASIIARYGEDSVDYEEALAQVARRRFEESVTLEGNHRREVMIRYDILQAMHKLNDKANKKKEREAALEKARVKAMALHIEYAERDAAIAEERNAAARALRELNQSANQELQRRLTIAKAITDTGNDEVAVAEAQAEVARETYEEEMRRKGLLGDLLKKHMDLYDLVIAAEAAAEGLSDKLKEAAKAVEKFTNFDMNLDVQIAKLTAELDALKNNKDAETASFIAGERLKAEALYATAKAAAIQANDIVALANIALAFVDTMDKLDTIESLKLEIGKFSGGSSSGGSKSKTEAEKLQEEIQKLIARNKFLQQTSEITGEQLALEEELYELRSRYGSEFTSAIEQQTRALLIQQRALQRNKDMIEGLADSISGSIGDAFYDMVTGAKTFEDAFRAMVLNIINELFRVLVVQQMVAAVKRSLMGPIGGFVGGFANGAAFQNGRVVPFANGGVVSSPTYFPMAGNQTGLMGEAGAEAIMPLRRGSDGKLGVTANNNSEPVVNQKIINVLDPSIVGDFLSSRQGEKVIMNVMRRNGVV